MYSAFYIQPDVEKEKRIVRCDPFVQKYTIAMFVLRSQRRKDRMGGVLVGDLENLKRCWDLIEANDDHYPDDPFQIMNAVSEAAQMNKCNVIFVQEGEEPTFSATDVDPVVLDRIVQARSCLNAVANKMIDAGMFMHVNPSEYFDIEDSGDDVVFHISKFAVGSSDHIAYRLHTLASSLYPKSQSNAATVKQPDGSTVNTVSISLENGIRAHIVSSAETQDRFLITSSFSLTPQQANDLVLDYKNDSVAVPLFKSIATAGNVFLPSGNPFGKNAHAAAIKEIGNKTNRLIAIENYPDFLKSFKILAKILERQTFKGLGIASYGGKDYVVLLKDSSSYEDAEKNASDELKSVAKEPSAKLDSFEYFKLSRFA